MRGHGHDDWAAYLPEYELGGSIGDGGVAARHRRTAMPVLIERVDFAGMSGGLEVPDHPHVSRLLDVVRTSSSSLVVEERRGGDDALAGALRAQGMAGLVAVAVAVLAGLEHIHQHGIVHGGIQPGRLLLESSRPRIGGCGIAVARAAAGRRAQQASSLANLRYLGPEHAARGGAEPPSDLYALMFMVYEALAGGRPWEAEAGDDSREFDWRVRHDLPPVGSVAPTPTEIGALVDRSLRRDRTARCSSASELGLELARAAQVDLGDRWLEHSDVEILVTGPLRERLRSAAPPSISDRIEHGTVRVAPPSLPPLGVPRRTAPEPHHVLPAAALQRPATTTPAGSPPEGPTTRSRVRSWTLTIVVAVILTIVLRMFIVQVFSIPSGSMEPTLQVGDRVAVNRLSYRLGPINRGDVVVFTNPDIGQPGEDDHVVKRVIGVAGDEIVLEDGAVVRNGEALSEPYAQGASHPTSPDAECTRVQPCRVPEGKLWVMGDNREMSLDSRGFGPIDTDAVVGQGTWLVWPPGRVGAVGTG